MTPAAVDLYDRARPLVERFHRAGLVLIELHGRHEPLANGERATGKEPVAREWQRTRSSPPLETCLGWLRRGRNFGHLPGPSGRAVLDVEPDGLATWPREKLPSGSLRVRTPSGGYHLHLDLAAVERVLGRELGKETRPGAELFGRTGQVLLPGCFAWSNKAQREGSYEIEEEGEPLADEEAIREILAPFTERADAERKMAPTAKPATQPVALRLDAAHNGWSPRARAAFEREIANARNAPPRKSHDYLRDAAHRVASFVGEVDLDGLRAALVQVAHDRQPHQLPEALRAIEDGIAFGLEHPREDPPRVARTPAPGKQTAPPASEARRDGPPEVRSQSAPFPWYAPDQLPERDPANDLLRGFLAPGELACLAALSGSGKTFLVLELAVCVAGERAIFLPPDGPAVQRHGPVLYFAAEGFSGLKERLRAADPQGRASARLRLCPSVPMLLDGKSVEQALESARALVERELHGEAPLLVVLDTFAQAVAGENENDNGAMGAAVRALHAFTKELGCAVLLVHHARKNRQEGESFLRGAGSLLCALDAAWGIEPEAEEGGCKRLLLVTEKMKDRPGDAAWRVLLEPTGRTLRVRAAHRVTQLEREIVNGKKRQARARLRQDAILGVLLGQKHGLPIRSIHERLIGKEFAVDNDAIRRALDHLRAAALVELIGRPGSRGARYRLTDKGERVADERLGGDFEPPLRHDPEMADSSSATLLGNPPRKIPPAEEPPRQLSSATAKEESAPTGSPDHPRQLSSAPAKEATLSPRQRLSLLESRAVEEDAEESAHERALPRPILPGADLGLGDPA